ADGKAHPFIHLMDGGLADNIGARAVQDAYARGFIRTKLNNREITKLVIIVVNAATDPQEKLSRRESPPDLPTVAYKTSTVSMDNYSVESIALITEHLKQRLQAQKDLEGCRRHLARTCPAAPSLPTLGTALDPYVMEVSFQGAATLDGEDPAYYLNLPTSFRLEAEQVERLVHVGPKLLRALPQYQCLLAVLEAEAQGAPRPEACPLGAGIFGPEEE
ncbi:MAG: patatin-like phospholipase family protein, partial [Nitrospirales bacterium]